MRKIVILAAVPEGEPLQFDSTEAPKRPADEPPRSSSPLPGRENRLVGPVSNQRVASGADPRTMMPRPIYEPVMVRKLIAENGDPNAVIPGVGVTLAAAALAHRDFMGLKALGQHKDFQPGRHPPAVREHMLAKDIVPAGQERVAWTLAPRSDLDVAAASALHDPLQLKRLLAAGLHPNHELPRSDAGGVGKSVPLLSVLIQGRQFAGIEALLTDKRFDFLAITDRQEYGRTLIHFGLGALLSPPERADAESVSRFPPLVDPASVKKHFQLRAKVIWEMFRPQLLELPPPMRDGIADDFMNGLLAYAQDHQRVLGDQGVGQLRIAVVNLRHAFRAEIAKRDAGDALKHEIGQALYALQQEWRALSATPPADASAASGAIEGSQASLAALRARVEASRAWIDKDAYQEICAAFTVWEETFDLDHLDYMARAPVAPVSDPA